MAEFRERPHCDKVHIMIVDEHASVRKGMGDVLALEPDLELTWKAGDLSSALEILNDCNPDIVLVDLSLQRGEGLELIKNLRLRRPDTKILVLSVHDEVRYAELARRAGAEGFVDKGRSTGEILRVIRSLLAS